MSQVELLYQLQQTDDAIREGKKRLAKVVRLQTESKELIEAQGRVRVAESELQKWRARYNDLNLELSGLNGKAKRSEDRLYSGTVTNPKELSDLQQELDSLGRRREILEDELLEAMIMLEEVQEEDSEASASYERIQAHWELDQASLDEEKTELIHKLGQLDADRRRLVSMIEAGSLVAYENASRRVGALAVVPLENGRCRGCLVKVPANLARRAEDGKLVNCDNCGRILIAQ
jgi:predicted  nucleic acid-binding Zn-ribbon protein